MLEWVVPRGEVIKPKKECIKSCETCFAKNALTLNVMPSSIKLVCFPKYYGSLASLYLSNPDSE